MLPEVTEELEQEENDVTEFVTYTVKSGATSVSVSNDLEKLNVVLSAKDFDQYLNNHDYSRRINIGTYELPLYGNYDEIAKIITKSR